MKLSRNDTVLLSCVVGVAAMVGLSFAAVPLYYAFCRATGYGGTPNRADAAPGEVDNRTITVRFDTNVDPALAWSFQPVTRTVSVRVGENKLVFFRARNDDSISVTGHAAFNVEPEKAAVYFTKIQCFCFTEQKLAPGETVEMPVSFFIDPAILKDRDADGVTEITLSYTFYPSVNQAASAPPGSRS
jgi:cytochrome c oxidase assembly protein subunit 11